MFRPGVWLNPPDKQQEQPPPTIWPSNESSPTSNLQLSYQNNTNNCSPTTSYNSKCWAVFPKNHTLPVSERLDKQKNSNVESQAIGKPWSAFAAPKRTVERPINSTEHSPEFR